MTVTATIRVPEQTRDQLAALASQRELSLSAYLGDVARRERRAATIAAARAEALLDEASPETAAEYELWEGTLGDGID